VRRIGAIHAVLAADQAWRNAPREWGARVEALLIRAEQHHLADCEDAVAFATQGLRWHPRLDEHPRVERLLADCVGHPARYRRLSGRWTHADWQIIVADLDAAPVINSNRLPQGACR
jgi:hypothetical protein